MITRIKRITTETPTKQIWKFLHFFRDTSCVAEKIREIHKIPKSEQTSNIKKQATQVEYCIRQAEEYFNASSTVNLSTRPVLLYYGAVSLSRALVLLRKSGDYSIDVLREKKKHNHHGLEQKGEFKSRFKIGDSAESFFSSIQSQCYLKKKTSEPWGHFPLFYESLVPCTFVLKRDIVNIGKVHQFTSFNPQSCANVIPLKRISAMIFNGLDILKSLPDMCDSLMELNIIPDLSPGDMVLTQENHCNDETVTHYKIKYRCILDGLVEEQTTNIISYLNKMNPLVKIESRIKRHVIFGIEQEYLRDATGQYVMKDISSNYIPDMIEDISGRKFYLVKPEDYLTEPAAHLILLFNLGMLARYSPDIWIPAIDKNIQIAELTDSFLNLVYRKFPNLILDQLTWTKHDIN